MAAARLRRYSGGTGAGMRLTTDLLPEGSDALAGAFLAADYHGGMMTALYALASSGSLELCPGEGLYRLTVELGQAIQAAEDQHYWDDAESLRALRQWCEDHERGQA
jgi:hypothetical protein